MPEETAEQQTKNLPPLSREVLDITLANMFSADNYKNTYLFYAHMIGQCRIVLMRMEAPAAVSFQLDHYNLYINPELFDNYTLEERLFILFHEMMHILNGHVARCEDRNPREWNYATDCAINQLGDKDHMPHGCIIPETFPSKTRVPDKLSAEQYYEYLDPTDLPEEGLGFGHDRWNDSVGDSELQADITKNMIEKAANETAKSRGNLPSKLSHYLDLHTRKRELDWKKVLRSQVSNKKANTRKTIMRKDRRNPDFDHLKGHIKDHIANPLIIADVSGSVSDNELTGAISESLHVCKAVGTDLSLIQVDTEAYAPQKVTRNMSKFNRKACGGTVLAPAIDKAKEHNLNPTSFIVITDGEICQSDIDAFGRTGKPVIWLITSNGTLQNTMNYGKMKGFKLKS